MSTALRPPPPISRILKQKLGDRVESYDLNQTARGAELYLNQIVSAERDEKMAVSTGHGQLYIAGTSVQ
jgi:hypothetical protein